MPDSKESIGLQTGKKNTESRQYDKPTPSATEHAGDVAGAGVLGLAAISAIPITAVASGIDSADHCMRGNL